MDFQQGIIDLVEKKIEKFNKANDEIWGFAETRFGEFKSAALLQELLAGEGFAITTNIGEAQTAFIAEWGSGKPVVGFLGEYDALSYLSQEADNPVHTPIVQGAPGHGCGHNTLGAGSASAAVAVKDYLEQNKLPGTVRFYGCPAEENAGGKTFMVRAGAFDDCDIAITWHTGSSTAIMGTGMLANFRVFFTFHGQSAHAAGTPHLGRSALDAEELMNVGVNYMREHMIDQARVHYAVTNPGGTAPNVVQPEAQVLYAIRAPKVTQVRELLARITKIAQGAALMTETTVDIRQVSGYTDYISNPVVEKLLDKYLRTLPKVEYTQEELDYAQKFKDATPKMDLDNFAARVSKEMGYKGEKLAEVMKRPIFDEIMPVNYGSGSTDVGDVSWVVPTGQFFYCCYSMACPGHAWQEVAQGKSSILHKGMKQAAKVMALTGMEFFANPALVDEAKAALKEELGGETYISPLPDYLKPEIW